MKSTHWFILLLSLMSWQCHTQPVAPVSGQVLPAAGWRPVVYLVQPKQFSDVAASYSGTLLDSVRLDASGHFAFSNRHIPAEPSLVYLVIQPEGSRFWNKLIDAHPDSANYLPLVVQAGTALVLQSEARRLQAAARFSQSSAHQSVIQTLIGLRRQAWQAAGMAQYQDEAHDEAHLMQAAERLKQFQAPLAALADTTHSFWAAVLATRWISPAGDYERTPEILYRQCERFQQTWPTHPFTAGICAAAAQLPVRVGEVMPDFLLPMAGGDTLSLVRLRGRTLTIIDLWASWCAPCRKENRDILAPLYKRYREKGLEIIGYAIESDERAWRNAIQKDGAVWPQASHLSGDESPFLKKMRLSTIPANFILNAEGKILAKNLHGEALIRLVEENMR